MNAPSPITRRSSAPLLVCGFLLLAFIVSMPVIFGARERAHNAVAQRALKAQNCLAELFSTMRQAENGTRGYLITGNPISIQTYNMALAQTPLNEGALDAALPQRANAADLAKVRLLVAKKLAELAPIVGLLQTGDKAGAAALINTDLNLHTMVDLRKLVTRMSTDEAALVARAQAAEARDAMLLQVATALAVLGTILLAGIVVRSQRDQTQRLRSAEADLIATNNALEKKITELDRIYNLSIDILTVSGFDRRLHAVSPAWERITGRSVAEATSRPFLDFVHPDDHAATIATGEALRQGKSISLQNRYQRADGSYCWLSWRAVARLDEELIYGVARDITAERERDERSRQSQKMELVGQLTGGVAHDFNNLLTIIMGSLELLRRDLATAEPRITRRIEAASEGARRAAALTHRLLAFSRRQPLAPKALDANRLVVGMSDMLTRTLGETIALEFVSGAGLWPVLADANQLENAILNLAVNARDAMPNGGHLTIETQNAYLDERYTSAQFDVQAGQYAQISITDTGQGMTAEVLAHVFEPFFTTKPQGQGTGLGLAQVYGFIKQSGGHVNVYSEPGQGTTIKLYLPRLRISEAAAASEAAALQAAAREASLAAVTASLQGNGETILLVEDEAGVRNFCAEILSDAGYHVLSAETPAQARQIFRETPGIAMLFTDVVLGAGMNGRELADDILRENPKIIVLFTTGYTRNAIIHHGRLDDGINFIGKPFAASALIAKIVQLFELATAGKATA